MCFPYMSASWCQGAKMVDFVAPSQTRENGLSQPFGLAREGYLLILATLAIQLHSYVFSCRLGRYSGDMVDLGVFLQPGEN